MHMEELTIFKSFDLLISDETQSSLQRTMKKNTKKKKISLVSLTVDKETKKPSNKELGQRTKNNTAFFCEAMQLL